MAKLKGKDIKLMFCKINNTTNKMINEFSNKYNDNKFKLISTDLLPSEGTGSPTGAIASHFGKVISDMVSEAIIVGHL